MPPSDNSTKSNPRNKQDLSFILRSGLAGGIAGCIAKTVVAPLDRVKILFQASNPDFQKYSGSWIGAFKAGQQIFRTDGVRGLLQGHSATLYRVFPYAAIKFMAYDQVHYILMPTRAQETNFKRFAAGAISGTISVFFTYPLEVIRVRMAFATTTTRIPDGTQTQRPSFVRAFWKMYHETSVTPVRDGAGQRPSESLFSRFPLLKFYRGFTVTIIGMVPYAGTSFLAWGYLRSKVLPSPPLSADGSRSGKEKATPMADLVIGAVSGVIGQTASYPFEVIRRRMQVGGLVRPDRWLTWQETVRDIWIRNGWRGFYVGLSIGFLKIVPMTAVSFAAWQSGKRVLGI